MGITIIIVGGILLMTVAAGFFDMMGKSKKNAGQGISASQLQDLESRLSNLEVQIGERDRRIEQLEQHAEFTSRLLEDKSK